MIINAERERGRVLPRDVVARDMQPRRLDRRYRCTELHRGTHMSYHNLGVVITYELNNLGVVITYELSQHIGYHNILVTIAY